MACRSLACQRETKDRSKKAIKREKEKDKRGVTFPIGEMVPSGTYCIIAIRLLLLTVTFTLSKRSDRDSAVEYFSDFA